MTSTTASESAAEPIGYVALIIILLALMIAALLASAAIGYAPLDFGAAVRDAIHGNDTLSALVLVQLRVPRAALGALVGFSLGITGAAMQGLLREPG